MSNSVNHNNDSIKQFLKTGFKHFKSFIKGLVLPISLSGNQPVILGKEKLNIPEWCIFELKLMVDLLFYGYVLFAIGSHFLNPVYVWFYFQDYLFGVGFFIGLTMVFNWLIRLYRIKKKKHLNSN